MRVYYGRDDRDQGKDGANGDVSIIRGCESGLTNCPQDHGARQSVIHLRSVSTCQPATPSRPKVVNGAAGA